MGQNKINNTANEHTFRMYLTFWVGQLFSLLGSQVVGFIASIWITLVYADEIYLSISMFLNYLPLVVLAPIAGVYADRWNKKKMMATADFLQALLTSILIVIFASGFVNIWVFFTIMTLRGVCQAFHQPVVSAVTPIMVPEEKLSRINGMAFLFRGAINIISPIIGAALLATGLTIGQLLWIDVITFLIAVTLLLSINIPKVTASAEEEKKEKEKKKEENSRRKSFKKEFKEGIKIIKNIDGMMSMMLLSLFLNFLIAPFEVLQTFFILINHSGSEFDLAVVSSSFGLGFIIGAIITSIKKEWKHKIAFTFGGLIGVFLCLGMMALAPLGMFWVMALGGVIAAIMLPIINTIIITIMQKVIPPDKLGRVNSIDSAISMGITPIGYILAGPIAKLIGVGNLFLACSILGILVSTIALMFSNLGLYRNGNSKPEHAGKPEISENLATNSDKFDEENIHLISELNFEEEEVNGALKKDDNIHSN
ncbi:MAG: MFS transporter [Promethearchaeota archaeon]